MSIFDTIKQLFSNNSGSFIYGEIGDYSTNEYINTIYDNPAFAIPNAKKVKAFRAIKFGVFNKKTKEKIDNHILEKMFIMPNRLSTFGEFMEYLITWYEAQDNGVLIRKISNGPMFTPDLRLYNPNNFDVYIDNGEIQKICIKNPYKTITSKEELDEYIWIKQPNVYNDLDNEDRVQLTTGRTKQRGFAIIASYLYNAWRWNMSVLRNGNSRPGLYSYDKILHPDDRKELKQKISAENGFGDKGRDLILGGDVKYTPMDHAPKDTEWTSGQETASKKTSVGNGVPAELTGSGESTYNNRLQAKKEMYEDDLIPFANDICMRLNMFLAEFLKENEEITYDVSSIPAMQKNVTEVIKDLNNIKNVSVNEYRYILNKLTDLGLEESKDPNANKIIVGMSDTFLDELGAEIKNEPDVEEDDE